MDRRHFLIGGTTVAVVSAGAAWVTAAQMGSGSAYRDATAAMRPSLTTRSHARDLIRYATLAPNGHNAQPWRFRVAEGRIAILPDLSRRTPVVDPDDHHLFVSLGCAAENLALAAAATGRPGTANFDPQDGGAIMFDFERGPPAPSGMFDAIAQRQSTRADYDGRTVSPTDLDLLAKAAAIPGVDLALLTDRPRINAVRDLVVTGNSAQMADKAFVRELKSWLRFNPTQALRAGDGLYSVASGNPAMPDWLGPYAFDLMATAESQNESYARQIRTSAGIAVFVGAGETPADWVAVGRACQRFALQATALGMKHAYINQPVEVPGLRPELATLIGAPGRRPDIVMRFGYGPAMPFAPRRPVASVIIT